MSGYLKILNELKAKTGFSLGGKFNNDFGGYYYIVNNYQRAKQIEQKLTAEMIAQKIEVISPPNIDDYKSAFLYIANIVLKHSSERSNITEFSNEWIGFFMAGVAIKAVEGSTVYDKEKRTENIRMNLAAEYATFLFDVEEYEAADKMKTLKSKYEKLEPEKYFFNAYEEYMNRRQLFGKQAKFFDRMSAFAELKEYLNTCQPFTATPAVLIIEDYNDMEPLYKTLVGLLEKKGMVVFKVDRPKAESGNKGVCLYHFMSPLDEAEATAYSIKELITLGAKPEDIAVAAFGNESAESLRFALERFGVSHNTSMALSGHHAFVLFAEMIEFAVIENEKANGFAITRQLLGNNASALRLTSDNEADKVFYMITKMGRLGEGQLGCLKIAAKLETMTGQHAKEYADVAAILKDRGSLLKGGFKKLFGRIVDKRALTDDEATILLAEAAEKLDEQLPNFKLDNPNEVFSLRAALRSIGNMEYETDGGKSAGYIIPFMQDKKVFNICAEHYFICGLDAGIDRRQMISGTYELAKELGLPLPEDKRKEIMNRTISAYESGFFGDVRISYPYFDSGNKEKGPSALVRALADSKMKQEPLLTPNTSLLKAIDIIGKGTKVPGISYVFQDSKEPEVFSPGVMVNAKETLLDLFSSLDKKIVEVNGQKAVHISASSLKTFAMCPKKFFMDTAAKAAKLYIMNADSEKNFARGNFWHDVFMRATLDPGFIVNKTELTKAMEKAFKEAAIQNKEQIEVFDDDYDSFKESAEKYTLPVFIENEMKRREQHGTPYKIESEKELELPVYKEGKLEYVAGGRADRIDFYKDKIIIWDYKTGEAKIAPSFLLHQKKPCFYSENALQVSFYRYVLMKNEDYKDDKLNKMIYGGIIYGTGEDFLDEKNCRMEIDYEIIDENIPKQKDKKKDKNAKTKHITVDEVTENALEEIMEFMTISKTSDLVISCKKESKSMQQESDSGDHGKCRFCDVKFACGVGE